MKNFIDELFGTRVKVEKDGKEIVNVPGILALPGALLAPKASIIGTVAASLLGCSVHLESEDGKTIDVGKKVQEAAETVADTAKTAVKTIKEEMDKAWESVSADDPEECPAGEETDDKAGDKTDDIPTITVEDPEDPEKPE